jgi:hypothetical protein
MRYFAGFLVFFSISTVGFNAIADNPINKNDVRGILTRSDFVKGRFEQERILQGINRPIRSTGKFAIWRNNGIYWETSEPLFQATSFLKDSVFYWSSENEYEPVKDGVFRINEKISQIMLAFFTADFEQLEKDFSTDWDVSGDAWTITLLPSNLYVSKAIERVQISGQLHIENVVLDLATGDSTKITLQVTAEGNEPDAESRKKIALKNATVHSAE